MTTVNETREQAGRLSPADVNGVLFTRAGMGRRGYDETEVDVFLDRVHAEITRLIAEKGELRDEASRLRNQLSDGEGGAPSRDEASIQAVRILSVAQQTADQYVAEAEHYSRRVTSDAREQAEEIILEARRRAASALGNAERLAISAEGTAYSAEQLMTHDGRTRHELEEQVAYLKAFGQVCRTQLRSYLEALLRDVEDEWGRADPAAVTAQRSPRAHHNGSSPSTHEVLPGAAPSHVAPPRAEGSGSGSGSEEAMVNGGKADTAGQVDTVGTTTREPVG